MILSSVSCDYFTAMKDHTWWNWCIQHTWCALIVNKQKNAQEQSYFVVLKPLNSSPVICAVTQTPFFPIHTTLSCIIYKKNSSLTMKDNSPKWIKDNKAFMAANEPHDIFPKRASGYRVMLHEQEILHIEKKALGMTSLLIKWKEGATSERGERVQISVWSGLLHPQPLLSNILT